MANNGTNGDEPVIAPDGTLVDGNGDRRVWWWSPEAYAIKFAILTGLFVIFVAYFLGGYLHAQRRLKKGLPPLKYHRWLLSREQRAPFEPRLQQQFSYYNVQDGYAMHGYPPPPPAYNPNAPAPPTYENGMKPIPSQNIYSAPSGPPPSSAEADVQAPQPTKQKSGSGILSRLRR